MPIVSVDWDEMYPVFFIMKGGGYAVELSDEELASIAAAGEAFAAAQELLGCKLREAGHYS